MASAPDIAESSLEYIFWKAGNSAKPNTKHLQLLSNSLVMVDGGKEHREWSETKDGLLVIKWHWNGDSNAAKLHKYERVASTEVLQLKSSWSDRVASTEVLQLKPSWSDQVLIPVGLPAKLERPRKSCYTCSEPGQSWQCWLMSSMDESKLGFAWTLILGTMVLSVGVGALLKVVDPD